jgi:hypothetical protein
MRRTVQQNCAAKPVFNQSYPEQVTYNIPTSQECAGVFEYVLGYRRCNVAYIEHVESCMEMRLEESLVTSRALEGVF